MSPYQRHHLEKEIRFITSRSSGPGGQHVNKTETRVSLYWNLWTSNVLNAQNKQLIAKSLSNRINNEGDLILHSEKTRSQAQNKEDALKLFFDLLDKALAPRKIRKATKPTRASVEKRIELKKMRSATKKDRRKDNWE